MRALLLVVSIASFSLPAGASELNVPPGMGASVDDDTVSFAFVGEGAGGLATDEAIEAVRQGAEAWDGVACSRLTVTMSDPVETLSELPEGVVPVIFTDTDDPCFPARQNGDQPIGFTVVCPDYPAPTVLLNGETYRWRPAPVPFQSIDDTSGDAPVVDAASVITHEMGHALSLPHVDDPIATMFARYRRDGSQATLAAADDLALCEIFGGGASECESDASCPEGACVEGESYNVCDDFRAETGEFCSWSALSCAEECFFSSPQTGTGYCTVSCDGDASCPEEMVCRETSNGSSLCQFEFGEAEPTGCATGYGAAGWWPMLALLVIISRTRRLRSSP